MRDSVRFPRPRPMQQVENVSILSTGREQAAFGPRRHEFSPWVMSPGQLISVVMNIFRSASELVGVGELGLVRRGRVVIAAARRRSSCPVPRPRRRPGTRWACLVRCRAVRPCAASPRRPVCRGRSGRCASPPPGRGRRGGGVTVAVVDSGVDANPQFGRRVTIGPDLAAAGRACRPAPTAWARHRDGQHHRGRARAGRRVRRGRPGGADPVHQDQQHRHVRDRGDPAGDQGRGAARRRRHQPVAGHHRRCPGAAGGGRVRAAQ